VELASGPVSQVPDPIFEFAEQGTGITVHVVRTSDPDAIPADRVISPIDDPNRNQKGVQITEVAGDSSIFGVANWGTPQGIDFSQVYSHAIHAFVEENCPADLCINSDGTEGKADIQNLYVKHTLNHELLHDWNVAGIYDSRQNGYHVAPSRKSGPFVMESFVVVKPSKKSPGTTNFYIGIELDPSSAAAVKLN
jgi:hypothetical protein